MFKIDEPALDMECCLRKTGKANFRRILNFGIEVNPHFPTAFC
jgi:hypothetical protein